MAGYRVITDRQFPDYFVKVEEGYWKQLRGKIAWPEY
jgi:hypothetical protein